MLIADSIGAFLRDQKLRGNSSKTVDYYAGNLKRFQAATGVVDVSDLTFDAVADWRLGLQESQLSMESVRTYDKAVRAWCNWLVRTNRLQTSPFQDLPRVKGGHNREYVGLTSGDLWKMMDAAKRPGKRHPLRNQAMLALLLDTGVRAGELASIQLTGINWTEGVIRVTGKTGNRIVPAHTSLKYTKRYVSRERQSAPTEPHLLTTQQGTAVTVQHITLTVRRLAKAAGVQATKLGPHTFRHTFALEYLRSGGDVFSLMRILGHNNIKTTERYVNWLLGDISQAHHTHSPGSAWL